MDHWVLRAAAMDPDRVAIAAPEQLTYAELALLAREAAGALLRRGVSPRNRVALALPPGPSLVAALHGCMLIGAVAVPIDLRLGEAERAARDAGAVTIVADPLAGPALAAASPLELEAIATVMHTSGTTKAPKAVPLTYGNWLASALGSAVALGLDPDERWLCPMPLVHVGGLSIPIRSAIYATTAVLHERFEVGRVLAALSDPDQRITLVSLVPTMLARLLDAGLERPPTLRWALLGGGPIAPALLARASDAGVPVAPSYGMTEACSQIATFGWPLPGVELRTTAGEVIVRGPIVAPGAVAEDGWLHTGDLGAFDDRGRLAITGRKADTIITGGENVAPTEVEAVLLEHPAVVDAGVFGRSHPEWGEALNAKVVLHDGLAIDAAELRAHCAARLAAFKVPKAVEVVESLPRTASGKLLRREL
jgi:O-succinylbenzoic acid--CoA ligase